MERFNFRGTRYDQGALAQAFGGTANAAAQQAALKAQAYSELSQAITRGSETALRGVEGRRDRTLARDESALDRAFRASETDKGLEADRRRFDDAMAAEDQRRQEDNRLQAEIMRFRSMTDLAGSAAGQGYPAPQLLELLDERFQQNPVLSPGSAPVGPLPGGIPRGGPGGFMVEPQTGGDPVYQSLQREGGGRKFTDLPAPEPQKSWEQIKFALTEEQKSKVAATTLELARMRAQRSKDIEVEEETTLAAALGFEVLDENELEEAVKAAYPELVPAKTVDGKEGDRRALDAKIKLLTKKQKIRVPNGPGITSLEWGGAGGDPTVIVGALSEAFGEDFAANPDALPMTMDQAQAYASKKLLERYPEYVNRFRPASVQLQGDLGQRLGQDAEDTTLKRLTGGELQPMSWTPESIGAAGFEFARLPKGLQAAAHLGMTVEPTEDGGLRFQPMQDGTPAPPSWQAELDALVRQSPGRAEAASAAGVEAVTPSEMDKGAAGRRAKGKGKAPAAAPQSAPASAPRDALEEYRLFREQKSKPKPDPKSVKVPPSMRLVEDDSALLRLLTGAGGGP